MVELFEDSFSDLVRNVKHLYDVTLLGTGTKFVQNSWEETGWELNVRNF